MCYSVCVALIFPGSSRVWVLQNPNQDLYQVGDTAVIHCKVESDRERVEECTFQWTIPNPNDSNMENIKYTKKYDQRIRYRLFNDTFGTLTLKNLSLDDTDNLKCITDCNVDGNFKRNFGEGITLQISDKKQGWGKY